MKVNMDREQDIEVQEILKEHKKYFNTGITMDFHFRLEQLRKLKSMIKVNEKDILNALYKDLGKCEFEAYATEVGFLLESIGYMIRNLRRFTRAKKVRTSFIQVGAKSYIYNEPYGTVLIIGPFNYPFQLLIEPLIGAIAAGNSAIIKPSEHTPNVSSLINKIIKENFDESYIRVVEGDKNITASLINSKVDYIFFTGSVTVGKIIMQAAAKNMIPVTLELGGKSPCIVDKYANLQVAAERIAWGKFINAGQTCVAPDYILVHRDVKEEFCKQLKRFIVNFYGYQASQSKDYGRIVNRRELDRLISIIEKEKEKIIYGGEYDIDQLYIEPTIIDNVQWTDTIMEDEIFGPILPIIEYEDLDSVITIINSHPKPLALYVFSEFHAICEKLVQGISFGGGCVNDTISHVTSTQLPFGGVGSSGLGAYHGKYSYDAFSHKKSVMKKSTKISLKFIYPPYNKRVNILRKLMRFMRLVR